MAARPFRSDALLKERTASKITISQPDSVKLGNSEISQRSKEHRRAETIRQVIMGCNIMMIIIGFIFIIFGCLMIWSSALLEGNLRWSIKAYAKYANLANSQVYQTNIISGLMQFTAPIGELLLVLGIFTVAISWLGFYGTFRRRRFFVYLFSAILLTKILIVFTVVFAYHMDTVKVTDVVKKIAWKLVRDYRASKSTDTPSALLNVVMPVLKCCGLDSGNDFSLATKFDRTYEVPNHLLTLPYPISCCKLNKEYRPIFDDCPLRFTDYNSNISRGCWPILQYYFRMFYSSVSYAATIFSVLELGIVVLAIYMCILKTQPVKNNDVILSQSLDRRESMS